MSGLPFESERITDTMTAQSCGMATLFRAFDRRGDVDAQPEVRGAYCLHEIFRHSAVVKDRGRGRSCVQAFDDCPEIRLGIASPVRERIHRTRWPQPASMSCVAEIDRTELQSQFQKPPQTRDRILIIFPAAADREHYVIVAKAGSVSVAMQSIGHLVATSCGRTSVSGFVIRPRPV